MSKSKTHRHIIIYVHIRGIQLKISGHQEYSLKQAILMKLPLFQSYIILECLRWVPPLLSFEQECVQLTISRDSLKLLKADATEFIERFMTMDETWVHHHTSGTKNQSKK
ncbi:unnamed protein product [Euphydryas editha]|uniref:Uncharacterized protein n=1 Tax=Euphydryas editha TaxID=104508 RepID=A0AAU9UPG9_EUPED|nr:unnamed protein product [Euphydryas editha]